MVSSRVGLLVALGTLAALCMLPAARSGVVPGTALRVPQDYATIQEAIDAAPDDGFVVVGPGTYAERIDYGDKALTVVSVAGAGSTVIDGGGIGPVVTITAAEGSSPTLEGFTVTNGKADFHGGGILTTGGPAVIRHNRIVGNSACTSGGGIAARFSHARIVDNVILQNRQSVDCSAGVGGGGVSVVGEGTVQVIGNIIEENLVNESGLGGGIGLYAAGTPTIARNVVRRNSSGERGGGISMLNDVRARVENNILVENSAMLGGGVFVLTPADFYGLEIVNNTFVGNVSTTGASGSGLWTTGFHLYNRYANNVVVGETDGSLVHCDTEYVPDAPVIQANDVLNSGAGGSFSGSCSGAGAGGGNIALDPKFADPAAEDFMPLPDSPLVDAGSAVRAPPEDIVVTRRPLDGDDNGSLLPDIGAYELVSPNQEPPADSPPPLPGVLARIEALRASVEASMPDEVGRVLATHLRHAHDHYRERRTEHACSSMRSFRLLVGKSRIVLRRERVHWPADAAEISVLMGCSQA